MTYGRQDVITCDQLAYLQAQVDDIVATDVHYFGDYLDRPAGNDNIDILIYNIVDEDFFDPEFGSYIAGFFSVGFQEEFDRNIVFVDSLDWEAPTSAARRTAVTRTGSRGRSRTSSST